MSYTLIDTNTGQRLSGKDLLQRTAGFPRGYSFDNFEPPADRNMAWATEDTKPTTTPFERTQLATTAVFTNGEWVFPWNVIEITVQEQINLVKREAIRRIDGGFSVTSGQNTYDFESTPEEREEIQLLASEAIRYVQEGGLPTDDSWFNGGTVNVQTADGQSYQVNARQMALLGKSLLEHVRGHKQAARTLIDTNPIPTDYTDNSYWP